MKVRLHIPIPFIFVVSFLAGATRVYAHPDEKLLGDSKTSATSSAVVATRGAIVFITTHDVLGSTVDTGTGFVVDAQGTIATTLQTIGTAVTATAEFDDGRKVKLSGTKAVDFESGIVLLAQENEVRDAVHIAPAEILTPTKGALAIVIGHSAENQINTSAGFVAEELSASNFPKPIQELIGNPDRDTAWVLTLARDSNRTPGGPVLDVEGRLLAMNAGHLTNTRASFGVHVKHLAKLMPQASTATQSFPISGLGVISTKEVAAMISNAGKQHIGEITERLSLTPDEADKLWAKTKPEQKPDDINSPVPPPAWIESLLNLARTSERPAIVYEALSTAVVSSDLTHIQRFFVIRAALKIGRRYMADSSVRMFARQIGNLRVREGRNYLYELLDKSKIPSVRATALYSLYRVMDLNFHTHAQNPLDTDCYACLRELDALYSDHRIGRKSVKKLIKVPLFEMAHLTIERKAAIIEATGIDGNVVSTKPDGKHTTVILFTMDQRERSDDTYAAIRKVRDAVKDLPVRMVTISWDSKEELERLLASGDIQRPVISGLEAIVITDQWNIEDLPAAFVVNHLGVLQHKHFAYDLGESLLSSVLSVTGRMGKKRSVVSNRLNGIEEFRRGSDWKYLDDNSAPPADWLTINFDDSAWLEGPATIGFGWGDEVTTITKQGQPTYYLRKQFQIDDLSKLNDVVLSVSADDGYAIYLNGAEVARTNLRPDATHETLACDPARLNGRYGELWVLPKEQLRGGNNVLAVEVHQEHRQSADLRFNANLTANLIPRLADVLKRGTVANKIQVMSLVQDLDSEGAPCLDMLEELAKDKSFPNRLDAFIAAMHIDPSVEERFSSEEIEELASKDTIFSKGLMFWTYYEEQLLHDDRSYSDYEYIRRGLHVAIKLGALVDQRFCKALIQVRLGNPLAAQAIIAKDNLPELYSVEEELVLCLANAGNDAWTEVNKRYRRIKAKIADSRSYGNTRQSLAAEVEEWLNVHRKKQELAE